MEPDTSSSQPRAIPASKILVKIERGQPVEYEGVIVEGGLDLSKLDLPIRHVGRTESEIRLGLAEETKLVMSPINIMNSKIQGTVNLGNTIFQESVIFEGTNFSGDANFVGAQFGGDVDFEEVQFSSDTDFGGAQFGGDANFVRTEFSSHAYFEGTRFSGDANFVRVQFSSYANFRVAQFSGDANFERAQFSGNADFLWAQFGGDVDFEGAQFSGNAYFRGAQFSGDVDFWGAQFSGNAYFEGTQFSGDAYFEGTQFSGYAEFERTQFSGYVDFVGAQFSGDAYFGGAQFCGYAEFVGAQFSGDALFAWAQFGGDADFERTMFDKELSLNNSKFDRLYITWNSIRGNLVYDGPVYLALIKNFKITERFSDADDCYYQYRKECQARKKWYSEHRFNWSKLLDCIGWVSCGYGVRIGPIILWIFGSVFGFTFLYKLLSKSYGGIIESGPSTVTMGTLNNSTQLLTFSSGDCAVSPSWGECLYFSFTALTGGTPDGLHPAGLCKYAVMIEGVLGYLFLVLFVVVLARKLIR